jgi:Uma2 family endonuclease
MSVKVEHTIEDLYFVEGNAELVNGEIIEMPPVGDDPNRAGGKIFASLLKEEKSGKPGRAYTDGVGFAVTLPHRKAFGPDAAFYTGKRTGMRFLQGAPDFAVEVRSETDYGNDAEERIAKKIADYLTAGTKVVWDVDLLSTDVIKAYHSDDPTSPIIYRRGDIANAEPAVPGWTFPVNDLFE